MVSTLSFHLSWLLRVTSRTLKDKTLSSKRSLMRRGWFSGLWRRKLSSLYTFSRWVSYRYRNVLPIDWFRHGPLAVMTTTRALSGPRRQLRHQHTSSRTPKEISIPGHLSLQGTKWDPILFLEAHHRWRGPSQSDSHLLQLLGGDLWESRISMHGIIDCRTPSKRSFLTRMLWLMRSNALLKSMKQILR